MGSPQVLDNSLTSNDLADSSVGANELQTNAVSSTKIADGTVVAVDPLRAEHVVAAERGVAEAVFGIVSTQPGVLLGAQMDGLRPELLAASDEAYARGDDALGAALHDEWAEVEATRNDRVAVALAGRVPVKADLSGGPIRPGDRLGLGASAGVAAKWYGVGPVVGLAAEAWDGATETLVAFCHVEVEGDATPVMPLVATPVRGTGIG